MKEPRFCEWVKYFQELDALGIPYGLSDMVQKARELDLPIPENIEVSKN